MIKKFRAKQNSNKLDFVRFGTGLLVHISPRRRLFSKEGVRKLRKFARASNALEPKSCAGKFAKDDCAPYKLVRLLQESEYLPENKERKDQEKR